MSFLHVLEEAHAHPCPPAGDRRSSARPARRPGRPPAAPASPRPTAPGSSSPRCTAREAAAGAPGHRDYVELYNPTDEDIDLAGTLGAVPLGRRHLQPQRSHAAQRFGARQRATSCRRWPPARTGRRARRPSPANAVDQPERQRPARCSSPTRATVLTAPPRPARSPATPAILDLVGYGATNTFETTVATGAGAPRPSIARTRPATTPTTTPPTSPPPPARRRSPRRRRPVDPRPTRSRRRSRRSRAPARTSPLAGRTWSPRRRGHGGVPDRRLQRLLPADRRHRRRPPDLAPTTPPTPSSCSLGAPPALPGVGDHVAGHRQGHRVRRRSPRSPAAAGGVKMLADPAAAPVPVPASYPADATPSREALEGMLLAPQGDYTVTDNYTLNQYAEIGLAAGTQPLPQPTDVAEPRHGRDRRPSRRQRRQEGRPRRRRLAELLQPATNTSAALPDPGPPIRVGAPATFTEPVVLD